MIPELRPESGRVPVAQERIALVEETLSLDKRTVVTGHVRMRSVVEEIAETMRGEVARETVSVEHVAIDREIEVAPDIRVEGEVTIMPVVEERLVLVKSCSLSRNCTSAASAASNLLKLRLPAAQCARSSSAMTSLR